MKLPAKLTVAMRIRRQRKVVKRKHAGIGYVDPELQRIVDVRNARLGV